MRTFLSGANIQGWRSIIPLIFAGRPFSQSLRAKRYFVGLAAQNKTGTVMRQFSILGWVAMLLMSIHNAPATAQYSGKEEAIVPGFRGILWGTHRDSIVQNGMRVTMERVEEDAPARNTYRIPGDDLTIGAVELNYLYYIFNDQNRFVKVYMEANKKYIEDMLFILKYKFGPPTETRDLGHVRLYEWRIDGVNFTLSEFRDRPTFILTIESNWEYVERIRKNINVPDF